MENRLRSWSYSAGGTGIAHGNRSPKETMIFTAFSKSTNSQNIIPIFGLKPLSVHDILSNFNHRYPVSKMSHWRPAKNMEANSVLIK